MAVDDLENKVECKWEYMKNWEFCGMGLEGGRVQ